MIYLVIAIISSSLVSLVMRVSKKYLDGNLGITLTNYVICTMMAAVYSGINNLFPKIAGSGFTLQLGAVTGVLYLTGLLITQVNIQKNGVVLSTIFQKLGLVIQILISVVIFKERPEIIQVLGIILCLAAVILINFEREQTIIHFKLGLMLTLLVSGFCEGMSKIHEELGNAVLSEHFLFYTFGTAMILCFGLIVIRRVKIGYRDLIFGVLLGIPNFFSAKFLLKSLESVPAVIAFPTFSVGAIVIITLVGVLVFKEKLSRKQVIGTAGILLALVLLNV